MIASKLVVFKHFNQKFQPSKGIILYIISRPLGALEEERVEFDILIIILDFKRKSKKKFRGGEFFLGAIFLGRVVVPSPK